MAETRLDYDYRRRHVPATDDGTSFVSGEGAAVSLRGAPDEISFGENNDLRVVVNERLSSNRHGHSFSFRGGGQDVAGDSVAIVMQGEPGSAAVSPGSTMLPELPIPRSSAARGQEASTARGDEWKAHIDADGFHGFNGSESISSSKPPYDLLDGSWSPLGHRRVHSAPNIMAGIEHHPTISASSRWRGDGVSFLSSTDFLARSVRDHAIPEGRRFEAVEPPLQPDISPDVCRPRSWRVRTQPPPWGAGTSVKDFDFGARDLSSLEWMPKLKASYFVDVRGQGEASTSTAATHDPGSNLMLPTSTIAEMASATRPFEEIKRLRLCQALDVKPGKGGFMGLAPSPTYPSSGRASFDPSRLTPRFSPGKGVNVFASASTSTVNGRPTFGGGGLRDGFRDGELLSPALTEPPTPPFRRDWKQPQGQGQGQACSEAVYFEADKYDQYVAKPTSGTSVFDVVHCQPGASESDQDVLPMEQRPLDEVKAVQALMSVGRGTRAQPDQASDSTSSAADDSGNVQMTDAPCTMMPSLDRLKPFDGGGDDDDDGLDKDLDRDLWLVVEKGCVCDSADCVYRDSVARIASRRHYHSKCIHTHNGGVKKGMVFHHHQLEKVQKHQRSHKREATKSAPYKRMTPEDHQAMEGAGVEGYHPEEWDPEETRQLDQLVNQLVAPVTHAWPNISRFFPTKSSIQCLLHWRFTLNDNGIIRGNGTWGAEEDERLRKLAPVFSSPATGPRWAKIAEVMPGRTAKQCRERYNNHVDPAIKKDKVWTAEEDSMLMELHAEHHNQFAKIARHIPGRCYDDVKNRFNLLVKRRQVAAKSHNLAAPNNSTEFSIASKTRAERMSTSSHQEMGVTETAPSDGANGYFLAPTRGQSKVSPKSGVKRSTPEGSV